jgi:thiol:disulfide interchange protein DsbA
MTKKLITPVLSICFLLLTNILVADNHWQFENNKHYRTLSTAENLSIAEEKIEVLEIFAYSCNHCFNFETYLDQFEKSKADYIDFKKMPVVFNDNYKMHARIYYTAESLGNLDIMHREIFKAMHLDRKSLMDENEIYEVFAKQGITKQQFLSRFRSFTVESKVNRAQRLTSKYRIRSTPTMVINGKYTANGPAVKTFEDMLAVSKELAEREFLSR